MRNMLRWCNASCSCAVMTMTNQTRNNAAERVFDSFTDAIACGAHSNALLHAIQIMGEAFEQM